jgi:hypothetical protein
MDYDPLSEVIDEPLFIDSSILEELKAFRGAEKFDNLPGINTTAEKARLSNVLNGLLDIGLYTSPVRQECPTGNTGTGKNR